jgi:peroxiredoxin
MHVWHKADGVREAKEFVKKHQLTFGVVVDADGQVVKRYAIEGVPTNVVIGKNGAIRYLRAGFEEDDLRQAIDAALKE